MEQPIWTHAALFLEASKQSADGRVPAVVIALLAYGSNMAFTWDPEAIAKWLADESPADDEPSAADLTAMQGDLLRFFVALPDGRWAPSPAMFSVTDANAETN